MLQIFTFAGGDVFLWILQNFKTTYFAELLQTTAPTISKIFMTTNFSYCNYDGVNSFNIWKKRVKYWESFLQWITAPYFALYF